MDLSELWSNVLYRRVLGLLLVFTSLVVIPSQFGVSPLSTTVQNIVLNSFSYNPDDNLLLAHVTLFRATDVGETVTVRFNLDPNIASAYAISSDPLDMIGKNVKTEVRYQYQFSGSLPAAVCHTVTGTDQIGTVLTGSDFRDAFLNAWNEYVSRYGTPVGEYRSFVEFSTHNMFLIGGGYVEAKLTVCEYDPSRYYLFSYKDKTLYSCFTLAFQNSKGDVVATAPICSDSVGSVIKVAKSGIVVGSVIYEGMKQLTWPSDLPVSPAAYLLVNQAEYNKALATSVFLVNEPDKIDAYRSVAQTLREYIDSDYGEIPYDTYHPMYQLFSNFERDQSSYNVVVLSYNNESIPHTKKQVSPDILNTLASQVESYLSSLMSNPVSNTTYDVNTIYQSGIELIQDLTEYPRPLVSHDLALRLNAEFVGLHFHRPRPKIVAATAENCTDKQCVFSVRLLNNTNDPNETGLVTVYVKGTYVSGQASVSLTSPMEEKVVRVYTVPSNVTSSVTDNVTIRAVAVHPLKSIEDVYHLSVTIQKTAECTPGVAACVFDQNKGVWKYIHCEDLYRPPVVTYCPKGYGCEVGAGCVPDVLQSVECTSTNTYVAHYQYSGDVPGTCAPDYVCDKNLASQNVLPPCTRRTVTPPPPPKQVQFHVASHLTYPKDVALGMLLVGLALLVI